MSVNVATVFDIKEFSLNDGPGIRTTVFLKGCPLRCQWCHNPEGLDVAKSIMVSSACYKCGKCKTAKCDKGCVSCGECVYKCPHGFRKMSGVEYTVLQLLEKICKNDYFLKDGGVTFSGGEPLLHTEFLKEILPLIPYNKAIQTSGYCDTSEFIKIVNLVDYVLLDIKLTNRDRHILYTGVDNDNILKNFLYLKDSGKPFVVRVPFIAGVNDDTKNLEMLATLVSDAKYCEGVEFLRYNEAAPSKYNMCGMDFPYEFKAPENVDFTPFDKTPVKYTLM